MQIFHVGSRHPGELWLPAGHIPNIFGVENMLLTKNEFSQLDANIFYQSGQ
jgi:hypothetical protein